MRTILNQLIYIVIAIVTFIGYSCDSSKEDTPQEEYGLIYGVVTDLANRESVANANVSLRPGGETAITGSDGVFEFQKVLPGKYSIVVSKSGYEELIDDYIIQVNSGRTARRDVMLRKLSSRIRITDMEGRDITSLDFGSDQFVTNKPFNIFNNLNENVRCEFIYSCDWIKSIYPRPDKISPGQNVTFNVEIDRSRLNVGVNQTVLIIKTNGTSNTIQISAVGFASEPIVETLPATDSHGQITAFCNTFHGRVTDVGKPEYHSRGFCFSTTNSNPSINDKVINVSGKGLGDFSYTYWDMPTVTTTFYYRAWVKYSSDNKVVYGNLQKFTFNDF